MRSSWVSWVLLFATVGCAYEEVDEVVSNGLDGQLHAWVTDESLSPEEVLRDDPLPLGGAVTLCVERNLRIRSGNGLGDSNTRTELVPMTLEGVAVEVVPSSVAVLDGELAIGPGHDMSEGTCLLVTILPSAAGEATLSVTTGALSDRWNLSFE